MSEKEGWVLYGFVVFAVVVLGIGLLALANILGLNQASPDDESQATQERDEAMGRLTMTSFDRDMALKLMDKDSDGKCDACGMPVEMCIESGQLECNMGPDGASKMGLLNSQHVHADWKVYVNGKALDLSDKTHGGRMQAGLPVSSFMHVDEGAPAPELPGDVLHMHAKNVPLWLWFESLGMEFSRDCLELSATPKLGAGEKYCNGNGKTLKFYVNGQPNDGFEKYVFRDGDKLLISYGDETDLSAQLGSITSFGGRH